MTRGQVLRLAQEICERIAFSDECTDPVDDIVGVSLALQVLVQSVKHLPPELQRARIMHAGALVAGSSRVPA